MKTLWKVELYDLLSEMQVLLSLVFLYLSHSFKKLTFLELFWNLIFDIKHQSAFHALEKSINKSAKLNYLIVSSKAEVKTEQKNLLAQSINGRELSVSCVVQPAMSSYWTRSGFFLPLCLKGIELIGGLLSRSTWGLYMSTNKLCRGICWTSETLNLILQAYEITHDAQRNQTAQQL